MGDVLVREALPADFGVLCRLYRAFHQYHATGLPDRLVDLDREPDALSDLETHEQLRELSDRKDAVLLLAEAAGNTIGLAEAYLREDAATALRHGYRYVLLQSLFVIEPWRGRRVGCSLLSEIETWGKANGAVEVRVDTWTFDGDPVGFYETAGYRTLRRTMVRPV
jgi:GNAT superfamily N-acetyltransferase